MAAHSPEMSERTEPVSVRVHFWLRVAGLALILAAQFGPRIWSGSPSPAPAQRVAVSGLGR